MFRKRNQQKKHKGGVFSKKGMQIATKPTWAFKGVPTEGGAFWWKQPSSRGRAGQQPLPSFLL